MGADNKANTLEGGSALQVGELSILEDDGERAEPLEFNVVARETTGKGHRMGNSEGAIGVSMGADANEHFRAAAHLRLVICVSLSTAASAEAPQAPMPLHARLRGNGRRETR